MTTRKILGLLLLFLPFQLVYGQNTKHTISGYVVDSESGEPLIGASIYIPEIKGGTSTNVYGYFSITLVDGAYNLAISYVGYETENTKIDLKQSTTFTFKLNPSLVLGEVVVEGEATDKIEEKTQMSTIKVSMDKVNKLPALMGERDVIKTIQLLPGVQSGSEGSSGLYVRGGGPDQNLILLDGVPVYNASHLFGFFSVFNADAINSVELVKGGFPARYGGRLSSVLDIRMKEGNNQKLKGDVSIGIIASKISLEEPIIKDKTSFIISARRTYIDVLTRPLFTLGNNAADYQDENGTYKAKVVGGYYFYDLNFKINHKFSDRSRLYASSYLGKDKFYFRAETEYIDNDDNLYADNINADLNWGNKIAALRWNYIINPKLFANTTVTYSQYKFNTDNEFGSSERTDDVETNFAFSNYFRSGIDDVTAKVDFDYMPHPNHYVRFGGGDIYHTFTPGVSQLKMEFDEFKLDSVNNQPKTQAHEVYAYIEDDWKLSQKVKINMGLHYSSFILDDADYHTIQPRFSGRLLMGKTASFKASYARMAQFLHLLTNPTIGLPTDLWVPATKNILPQYSHQVAIGYAQSVKKKYEISVEAYYKTMSNLIEYKDGSSFLGSDQTWEEKVEMGEGYAYGLEVLAEKKIGKLSGWVGYSLSWAVRQFQEINFGEPFPYKYDRRHDISVVATYELSKFWDFGLVWVYGTGNAFTLGLERYQRFDAAQQPSFFFGDDIEHISSRNNYRAPAYHRLDVGANYHKFGKWGESIWSFGLYNAYSRQNPFFLYFGQNNQGDRVLKQVALFPIIPSISYSFKF